MAAIVDTPHSVSEDRMLSGIAGLDEVLCGGFIRGNAVLFQGPPGSAKTTLGVQILVNGIEQYNERGILLSLEQPPGQIARDAQAFGWDLASAAEQGDLRMLFVRPQDLYRSLTSEDSRAIGEIRQIQEAMGARRILVDSITHFFRTEHTLEEQDRVFRDFLETLRQFGLTPLLIAEQPDPASPRSSHVAYAADTVINTHYDFEQRAGKRRRWLEVVKSRGQSCIEGHHPMRFTSQGIEVYPRIVPSGAIAEESAESDCAPCTTGIEGLDRLLRGGLARGSVTTVAGPEGTAKTTLGMHFLVHGCEQGEPGLLLAFEETPGQLVENMKSRGLQLKPHIDTQQLQMLHLPPVGLCLLETGHRLDAMIAETGIRRVVIDSVNDLLSNATDARDEQYFQSLYGDLFRRHGVTALFLERIKPSTGLESFASVVHASFADTIILLNLAELDGRLAKSIVIMKSRNAIADNHYHELMLTERGVEVLGWGSQTNPA